MANDFIIDDEENYIVRNKKEILQILNQLKHDEASLKIAFNQNKEDYIAPIISIDVDNNAVFFDMTIDEVFNKRLLASDELFIMKDLGVRIKWKTTQHTMSNLLDGNALRVEIPESVVRIQRRELFRLKTPMTNPLTCKIKVDNVFDANKKDNIHYELGDVSLGGVGLVVQKTLHPSIKVGAVFEECSIDFYNTGDTPVTLQVKNIIPFTHNNTEKYRVGLEFVDLKRSTENTIHQYTYNLERELLKTKSSI